MQEKTLHETRKTAYDKHFRYQFNVKFENVYGISQMFVTDSDIPMPNKYVFFINAFRFLLVNEGFHSTSWYCGNEYLRLFRQSNGKYEFYLAVTVYPEIDVF